MDLTTLIEGAMQLGVIPVIALFLVYAMHLQNKKLTKMFENQGNDVREMLRMLISENIEKERAHLDETVYSIDKKSNSPNAREEIRAGNSNDLAEAYPSYDVDATTLGDVGILKINGHLMTAKTLYNAFESVANEGIKKFIMDLRNTKYLNSTGLASFVSILTRLKNMQGEVVFANVPVEVSSVLELTRLSNLFPTFQTISDALKYFEQKT